MAGRGPTRQELIRRRRSGGFIGREGEVSAFRDALKQPPDEAAQFLFHVRGPAGVGKSTLVRQLETIARDGQAVTAYVDESVADIVETMEVISAQFAQQGAALKGFDKLLATYRQRRHEADAGMGVAVTGGDLPAGEVPPPSPSTVIASQLGLAGLGMIPGVGAFTGAVDPHQVAAGADRMKALISTRLRNHGDVELVLSPLDALTPVFLEELSEVARRRPWIVLFFDTYERTGRLLDTWLRDVLVSDRYGGLPSNVLVTLAGQSRLTAACWQDWMDLVTDWPLEAFTETEARQLLTGKGVTDERVVEVILQLSKCLPVLVSILAETQPGSVEEIGDPSGTAVERFLKWETDPARRAAALACAFPQELDEDVYRAAVEEDATELFGWLRSMPFVTDRSGHCRYHELVRGTMLRLQRRQSPARWEQLHTRLADAFGQRRARLEEAAAPSRGWWADETWRAHRLQETYHRLCADPRTALPAALSELLDAYCHGVTSLRRWIQTLARSGRDADSEAVAQWGEDLQAAMDGPGGSGAVFTLLVSRAGLDAVGRALAFACRGLDHRSAERYPQALADYSRATELDPQLVRAYFGRGRTHALTGSHDEAIADFERAIELDPGHFRSVVSRGASYRLTGRYEEALAAFGHAIELAPDYDWAFTNRGVVHRMQGRFEEALADFDRAVELREDPWALVNRGVTFNAMERFEEALPDFARALAASPDYGWAFINRGVTYWELGRHGEAIAQLDRGVELSPDHVWGILQRGRMHECLDRLVEAHDDFSRVIELKPDSIVALCGRGRVRHLMGLYAAAVEDFSRVMELRRPDEWTLTARGMAYRLMGRYEEALADLTRAVAVGPSSAHAHYETAVVLQALGRPECDHHLSRAVELLAPEGAGITSDPAANTGNLVLAHVLSLRWEEAGSLVSAFLGGDPQPGRAQELILALRSLIVIIPSAEPRILALCRTVEERFARHQ
ncbi:tetratricopeptide repeat protein [Streptomyces sp. NPDC040724]|uniref:tetratricopeptide repeat protein n=1 Tax=Streptomyces sp. NPDC040724 TaxID=3155612 RepID=UPI0033C5438D